METGCTQTRCKTGWSSMSRKIVRSIIPIAPPQYDSAYVNQLARSLDNFIDETRNPLLNIPNMPNVSVASILEEGDLFEDNGFVKIKKQVQHLSGQM